MHEVGMDILVVGRIAVQILVRVYLKDLKAGVGYNNVKAEVFKRRYVAAQLGDDAQHLVPVRKRALDLLLRVRMDRQGVMTCSLMTSASWKKPVFSST